MKVFFAKKLNIALVAALVLSGIGSFASQAFAVIAFNTFPISYTQELNHDYPMIDARNVTSGGSFSTSQADHDSGVSASPGDIVEFEIYYHNSGVPDEQATNVTIRANLPGGTSSDHEASANISSDQSGTVSSSDPARGGNIVIHVSGGSQTLDFIPGSVQWFPQRTTVAQIPANGDSLVNSGLNIGTVRGCFNFSGFVTFQARVGQSTTNSDLSISKRVLNVTQGGSSYQDSITANPGDRVRFQISFSTLGNISQNDVIVRDIMPTQLSYISGTEQVDGLSVGNEFDLFGSGRNMGTIGSGVNHTLIFDATVAGSGSFSGTTALTNTANVRSDQVSTRQDQATVTVQLVLGTSFSLRKTAFNLTQGADATTVVANPGDIIVYTLYYKNTGQTTITGADIEDDISDVTPFARIVDQGGAISVNGSIKYAPVDVPAGVEISRSFQVQVRNSSQLPANSNLVMVNTYGNQVQVLIRNPQIHGAVTPPRTGAGEWLAAMLAALATFGYWFYRRKLKVQSANLKF